MGIHYPNYWQPLQIVIIIVNISFYFNLIQYLVKTIGKRATLQYFTRQNK